MYVRIQPCDNGGFTPKWHGFRPKWLGGYDFCVNSAILTKPQAVQVKRIKVRCAVASIYSILWGPVPAGRTIPSGMS